MATSSQDSKIQIAREPTKIAENDMKLWKEANIIKPSPWLTKPSKDSGFEEISRPKKRARHEMRFEQAPRSWWLE